MTGAPVQPMMKTEAKLLWDKKNLYVGFENTDDDVWTDLGKRDDKLWTEEADELMIDADGNGRTYIELQVAPNGNIFDTYLPFPRRYEDTVDPKLKPFSWNSKMIAKVHVDGTLNKRDDQDKGWTTELAIPLEDVKGMDDKSAVRLPPEPGGRARPSPEFNGLAGELSARLNAPDLGTPVVRPEPRLSAAPPSEPPPSPQNDHNLAEMAQQLEAALRRTPPEGRPPVTDPLAVPPTAKVAPRPPAREPKPRMEPKFEPKFESKIDPKLEPKFDSKFEPRRDLRAEPKFELRPEAPTAPDKNIYDNLEEEMASLLGRPPDKP
jgi:hypothetical protein